MQARTTSRVSFTNMPNTQAAALVAFESVGQRTNCLERALDTGLSLEACRRAGNAPRWGVR